MKPPSTVKPPSTRRHDGVTVTPSPAYIKAGTVTVAAIGSKPMMVGHAPPLCCWHGMEHVKKGIFDGNSGKRLAVGGIWRFDLKTVNHLDQNL